MKTLTIVLLLFLSLNSFANTSTIPSANSCPVCTVTNLDSEGTYPLNLISFQIGSCVQDGELARWTTFVTFNETQMTVSIRDSRTHKVTASEPQTDNGQVVKFTFTTPLHEEFNCQRPGHN